MTQILISIGTGKGQLSLIRAAHDLGYGVVGVDQNAAADCAPYLCEQIQVSTYDSEAVVKAVKDIKEKYNVVGVLAHTSGPAIETAACVCDALGVAGIPLPFARCAVAKSALRKDAKSVGVATPKGVALHDISPPPFSLPWVVKPDVPLVGKKNVSFVYDPEKYTVAFMAAKDESHTGGVDVEELIPGIDVGYMAVVRAGAVAIDLLYDEYVEFPSGKAHGLGVGAPSIVSGTGIEKKIKQSAKALLSKWNVQGGFAFFSFRVTDTGNTYLYEANPGLCGDQIADTLLSCMWPGFNAFKTEILTVQNKPFQTPQQAVGLHCVLNGEAHTFADEDARVKAVENVSFDQSLVNGLRRTLKHLNGSSAP